MVGEGPVVLFVHGWSCCREHFRSQLADPNLGRARRLVAIDLPGHGESPPSAAPLTMDTFADAVVAVLDGIGADDAVLVGHSNGMPVAMRVLTRHPRRVAGLVSIDGPMRPFFTDPAQAQRMLAPLQGAERTQFAERIVDGMLPKSMPAERREFLRSTILATGQRGMAEGFAATLDPAMWSPAPIGVPLLVVNAPNPAWNADYEAFVRRLRPDVDWQAMAGVSHFLHLDEPAEFGRRLGNFLTRIGR